MRARRAIWCGLLPCLVGCAAATASGGWATSRDRNAVATMHVSKCGSCHTPPEPRTRTRQHIEDAFSRHHKRVRLTDEEWAMMVDYLAMPEGNTARQPESAGAVDR
jgi:hypothetical protein